MGEIEHKPASKHADANDIVAMQTPAPAPKIGASRDREHPTGYASIDSADLGPCKAGPDGGACFLNAGQRKTLVDQLRDRISAAQDQYVAALGDLRFDELIKKTEELPWYLSLVLAAATAAIESGIGTALEALKTPGVAESSLNKAAVDSKTASSEIDSAVAEVSEKNLDSVAILAPGARPHGVEPRESATEPFVRGVADVGKESVSGLAGRNVSVNSEETQEKEQAASYIDYLRDRSMSIFEHLREYPPGVATDAELLALFESFVGSRHTLTHYRSKLAAAIERYKGSSVSKMGRRVAWDEKRDHQHVELETRVAWLVTRGAGKRLIYVDRAFSAVYQTVREQGPQTPVWRRSEAYDDGEHQLSLAQDATWSVFGTEQIRHEKPLGPDLMINYVEPEFVELALEKQQHIWLARPETFMLDYSYAPPRMVKVAS